MLMAEGVGRWTREDYSKTIKTDLAPAAALLYFSYIYSPVNDKLQRVRHVQSGSPAHQSQQRHADRGLMPG